jgi:hypothetical protein
MKTDVMKRREVLGLTWNAFVTGVTLRAAVASALTFTASSCGGGGGGSPSSSPSGAGNPPPASTTPPPPTIASVSTSTPQALTSFSIATSNVDVTKPFTVQLTTANTGDTGSIQLTPIRSTSDGTIILAAPLHIDSAVGDSVDLPATLTIAQNSVTSAPVALTIRHLPKASEVGITLGQVSRATYIYQQLVIGSNLNALEALALVQGGTAGAAAIKQATGAKIQRRAAFSKEGIKRQLLVNKIARATIHASSTTGADLLATAQTQLTNTIMARNDVDRIVTDNTVSIPIATAPDGTAVAFNSSSVDMMDRVLAQYLLAVYGSLIPTQGATGSVKVEDRRPSGTAGAALTGVSWLTNSLSTAAGAFSGASSAATLFGQSPDATTTDNVLAGLSLLQTVVTVGGTLVAVGAAVAGAPAIAIGASAVVTYAALAGVAIGGAAIINDVYNISTTLAPVITGDQTLAQVQTTLEKQGVALLSDSVQTVIQSIGVGGLANAAEAVLSDTVASDVWPTVMGGILAAEGKDAGLAAAGFAAAGINLAAQTLLDSSNQAAQQDAADTTLAPGQGWAQLAGTVDISNSQGSILSGLTGINIEDGSGNVYLQTMADPDGNYTLAVPTGTSLAGISGLMLNAIDPVAGEILDSTALDLANLAPGSPQTLAALTGMCSDDDASDPDADDPDCD